MANETYFLKGERSKFRVVMLPESTTCRKKKNFFDSHRTSNIISLVFIYKISLINIISE